jgi:hypothetical protein
MCYQILGRKNLMGLGSFSLINDALASQIKDMKQVFVVLFLTLACIDKAQPFPPKAGMPGSSAVHKDSTAILAWASACSVTRGFVDVSNQSLGKVDAGEESFATGKALSNGVVSLGDGGSATCSFQYPIRDGEGADFVVFENSFDGNFLEFAFVEVSSDGENYFRFPAASLIDTSAQVGTFGTTDCRLVKNLAGTYAAGYGTPFDLAELKNSIGLNIYAITHVRVIDVVGSLQANYCTRDAAGRKINEPYPTPFAQGGFDLDAIGVLHSAGVTALAESKIEHTYFKNPISEQESILFTTPEISSVSIYDASGKLVATGTAEDVSAIFLQAGLYFVQLNNQPSYYKLLVYSSL